MDREDFMDIVYSELHSDVDNNRSNRIIDAADEYAESANATDKNVGTKISKKPLELARAISGLTEWQKHVQTDSNINRDITVAIEALKAQLSTNLAEVGTDLISRQQVIGALRNYLVGKNVPCDGTLTCRLIENEVISKLPSAQPKKGRWISADAMFHGVPFYCSECGENTRDTVMGKPRWKFCPNCGSYNGGEQDDKCRQV